MFVENSFGKTLDLLQRNMDVAMLRQDVIADNIANADTPNFKRQVVNFESALAEALASERQSGLGARVSSDRHIPFHKTIDYRTVRPDRQLDYLTTSDNNGNNVDIEQDSMSYLNSQLLYTLMSESVSQQFARINLVLGG